MSPAIIVIAFNRPNSLERLLSSLKNAFYPNEDVNLVISIDFHASKEREDVVKLAEAYRWDKGNKTVIVHEKNLGLRKHVLSCGEMSQQFGSIIMLEDDILVSPHFYSYAKQTLDFYKDDLRIAGISLYNHKKNFCNKLVFELLGERDADVFFLQIASSWGQAWTAHQWKGFMDWYSEGQVIETGDLLPIEIINWPPSSWLKFFIKYLVDSDKYFVYPKISLSTNFGDGGTHNLISNSSYQVPLDLSKNGELKFNTLDQSVNVYDTFFEIKPAVLKRLNITLGDKDFIVDTYGSKDLNKYREEYVLSSKPISSQHILDSYGINLKPLCLNIILENKGSELFFGRRTDFKNQNVSDYFYVNKWDYFSSVYSTKILFKRLIFQVKMKFFK